MLKLRCTTTIKTPRTSSHVGDHSIQYTDDVSKGTFAYSTELSVAVSELTL